MPASGLWMRSPTSTAAIFDLTRNSAPSTAVLDLHGDDVWLVKPQNYMNMSGGPVRALLDYYRLRVGNLLVAHDEIDLPPGTVKAQGCRWTRRTQRHPRCHTALRCRVSAVAHWRRSSWREEQGDELRAETGLERGRERRCQQHHRGGRRHADVARPGLERRTESTTHQGVWLSVIAQRDSGD